MPEHLAREAPWFAVCNTLSELRAFYAQHQAPYPRGVTAPSGLTGHCGVCRQDSLFLIDAAPGAPVNWRESLRCAGCGLFARWRACLHCIEGLESTRPVERLWLTERTSRFYQVVRSRFRGTLGTEYAMGSPSGARITVEGRRVLNQDVTQPSFRDRTFDLVVCQDVLEHVPSHPAALRQFRRVLRPGGSLFLTVPFTFAQWSLTRASLDEDGNVVHHLPPMYHQDPANPEGVLCYQDFGLDLLEQLREAGFDDAVVIGVRSTRWGYVDDDVIFRATRIR